ncbi:MAG: hypothetical protein FJX25_16200 [Alphaproteobacteria bacterium]|nr:hypothetical protein [Alphaproteobacteria bacterium]
MIVPRQIIPWSAQEDDQLRAVHGTMTIRQVAEVVGRSPGAVRARITVLGIAKKEAWSAEEEATLREAYDKAGPDGVVNLAAVAQAIGRLKSNVCRKARLMGLQTNPRRKMVEERKDKRAFKGDAEALAAFHRRPKWQDKPHPRGMAGKSHSQATKASLAVSSASWWASLSDDEKAAHTLNSMKANVAKNGRIAVQSSRGSWKADWREIGGKRVFFRSRWEANYARYLEWLRCHGQIAYWEHEPETFWFENIKRGVRSYLPDFLVTEPDGAKAYHEVKGWMDSRSKTTISRFKKYYPQHKLIVIDAVAYRAIKRKVAGMIEGWEQ